MHNRPGRNLDRTVFLVATTISESLPPLLCSLSLSLSLAPTNQQQKHVCGDDESIGPGLSVHCPSRSPFPLFSRKKERRRTPTTERRFGGFFITPFRLSVCRWWPWLQLSVFGATHAWLFYILGNLSPGNDAASSRRCKNVEKLANADDISERSISERGFLAVIRLRSVKQSLSLSVSVSHSQSLYSFSFWLTTYATVLKCDANIKKEQICDFLWRLKFGLRYCCNSEAKDDAQTEVNVKSEDSNFVATYLLSIVYLPPYLHTYFAQMHQREKDWNLTPHSLSFAISLMLWLKQLT